MAPRVLVIDNYDSFVYIIVQYLGELGAEPIVVRNDAITLAEIEAEVIEMAMTRYNGHMSEIARRLDIGRSTLYRKVRELGLDSQAAG